MNQPSVGDAGIASLLSSLVTDTGTLVRQEIKLASTEMGDHARTAAGHVGMVFVGGALTHAGVMSVIAAVVLGLGPWLPLWLSALVVGIGVAVSGVVVVNRSLKALADINAAPERAIQALKQDVNWMKEQVR